MSRNSHNLTDTLPKTNADIVFVESWDFVQGGYTPSEANAISLLRTDLDRFTREECSALRYHGASLVDPALARQANSWAAPQGPALGAPPPVSIERLAAGRSNRLTDLFTQFWLR